MVDCCAWVAATNRSTLTMVENNEDMFRRFYNILFNPRTTIRCSYHGQILRTARALATNGIMLNTSQKHKHLNHKPRISGLEGKSQIMLIQHGPRVPIPVKPL